MGKAFIVCGAPASGKSTYGKMLAAGKRAVLLDIDNVTERLIRLSLSQSGRDPDDRDSEFFKKTYREPIYETLFDIAQGNLHALNVVIVGPFTKEVRQAAWREILRERLQAEIEIHYVICRPDVRKQRMIARGNPRDRLKLADWEKYAAYYGEESPPEFADVFVDTSEDPKP